MISPFNTYSSFISPPFLLIHFTINQSPHQTYLSSHQDELSSTKLSSFQGQRLPNTVAGARDLGERSDASGWALLTDC